MYPLRVEHVWCDSRLDNFRVSEKGKPFEVRAVPVEQVAHVPITGVMDALAIAAARRRGTDGEANKKKKQRKVEKDDAPPEEPEETTVEDKDPLTLWLEEILVEHAEPLDLIDAIRESSRLDFTWPRIWMTYSMM